MRRTKDLASDLRWLDYVKRRCHGPLLDVAEELLKKETKRVERQYKVTVYYDNETGHHCIGRRTLLHDGKK